MKHSLKSFFLGAFIFFSLVILSAGSALAGFEEDLNALNAKSYKAKIAAINSIATSGDERTVPVLESMLEGNLYYQTSDKKIVLTEKKGSVYILTDPLTGKQIGEVAKSKIKKIRVNNKLRGLLKSALGGLTLLSPDPTVRASAADDIFKARAKSAIPLLEKAIQQEQDEGVKAKMELALAATTIKHVSEPEQKIKAIEIVSSHAIAQTKTILSEVLARNEKGDYIEQDKQVIAAAEKAYKKVDDELALWAMLNNVFFGMSLGSVLLLAAIGLAITFGVMGVINMAHGEMIMLGAYTTFVVQEVFRAYAPNLFDWSLLVAVPAAFLVSGSVGVAMERGIIRFLYGRPLETLLATWGISLMLQQLMRTIFGPTNQDVANPSWMAGSVEFAGGLLLTYNRLWIIVFALIVLAGIAIILRKTYFGLQMRAVTQNRSMAASMGIKTGWVDAMTFGLGSGVAGMAGVALSQIDNVSPNLGQAYIIDSFMVVVFGGVGNLWGTLVGAFSLGFVNKLLEPYAGAVLGKIIVLVAIILFIQKRPRGLFALKGRAVEA